MNRNHYLQLQVGLALSVATLASPSQTLAQSAETGEGSTYEMSKMVVTPTRSETPLFEAPYTAAVIDEEQIERRAYRTTPQMLRDVTGIMIQETSVGQGSPFIRGFTAFRNVFMIDGIRLNNSTYREGPNQYWATVDPYSIERLEVVKGPASVLYGSDAIGGSVNAITRSSNLASTGRTYGGSAFYRSASAESSHVGRGQVQVSFAPMTQMLFGGTGKHYGNLDTGGGTLRGTGYNEWDADLKLEHQLDEDARLVLAYQHVRQNNVPRTHSTINSMSFAGSTVPTNLLQRDLDQERQLAYAQYHRDNVAGFVDSVKFSLSWHQQDEIQHRIYTSGRVRREWADVGTLGIWAQLESETKIGNLMYGFDYYRDFVDSGRFDSRSPAAPQIQGSVGDDANYDLAGLFIQDTIDINDRLQAIVGGRGTYARADADSVLDLATGGATSVSEDWSALVGNARLLYRAVPDRVNVFAGVAQGFRAPNLSDLTRFGIARSGETEVPATDLDSERYITYEVGTKFTNEKLAAEIAVFYTDISDMIVRFPTGTVVDGNPAVTRDNVGDGWVSGVEFGLSYEFYPEWTIFGNTTFQQGELDTFRSAADLTVSQDYLSRTMPWMGQAGIRWQGNKVPVWAEVMGVFAAEADKLSSGDKRDTQRIPPGGTPGYALMDIRAGWTINEHFQLIASVDNVTDENYRVHGSGQNSPGRSFILSAKASF